MKQNVLPYLGVKKTICFMIIIMALYIVLFKKAQMLCCTSSHCYPLQVSAASTVTEGTV